MMEYHQNKAVDVAKNIFKLGLGPFGEDVPYILAYLNFLLSLNDEPSPSPLAPCREGIPTDSGCADARALFEKTVSKLAPHVAKPLWDRWAMYEYEYGDTASIQKLDGRLAELFPESAQLPPPSAAC